MEETHELRRRRRFMPKDLAFYRPTKQNSLFFISTGTSADSKDNYHQITIEDHPKSTNKEALRHHSQLLVQQNQQQNISILDKSELLTVGSVDENELFDDDLIKEDNGIIGGISNIPGLSLSEEEKLVEYSSYQSEDLEAGEAAASISTTAAPYHGEAQAMAASEMADDQLTISKFGNSP